MQTAMRGNASLLAQHGLPIEHTSSPLVVKIVLLVDGSSRMAPSFASIYENQLAPLLQYFGTRLVDDKFAYPSVRYAVTIFGGSSPSSGRLRSTLFTSDVSRVQDTLKSLEFEPPSGATNYMVDGLAAALQLLGRNEKQTRLCVLVSNSEPTPDYCMLVRSTEGRDATQVPRLSDILEEFRSTQTHLSIISPRVMEPLRAMFEKATGDSGVAKTDLGAVRGWNSLALFSWIGWDGKPLVIPAAQQPMQAQQQHAQAQQQAAAMQGRMANPAAAAAAQRQAVDAEPAGKKIKMDPSARAMPAGYAAAAAAANTMRPIASARPGIAPAAMTQQQQQQLLRQQQQQQLQIQQQQQMQQQQMQQQQLKQQVRPPTMSEVPTSMGMQQQQQMQQQNYQAASMRPHPPAIPQQLQQQQQQQQQAARSTILWQGTLSFQHDCLAELHKTHHKLLTASISVDGFFVGPRPQSSAFSLLPADLVFTHVAQKKMVASRFRRELALTLQPKSEADKQQLKAVSEALGQMKVFFFSARPYDVVLVYAQNAMYIVLLPPVNPAATANVAGAQQGFVPQH